MSLADRVDIERTDYTISELAELLEIDGGYLRRLCIEGERLKARKIGKMWVLDGRDVRAWLEVREADKPSQDDEG
jgi:excisionase family DNA binding protein